MVMVLPKPEVSGLDLVDSIVSERTREPNSTFFRAIADEWRECVRVYEVENGSPHRIPIWSTAIAYATRFKTLYSNPKKGSAQGDMLASLRGHDLDICPSCGAPTVPETLDHYLPKGKYPQFAVTPLNLTPMCDPCQRRKGEKTGDALTPRYFIHPYFDTFSLDQIVSLQINPPFTTPTFDLFPNPALTATEHELVTTHIRELKIAQRYVRFFRNEYRRLIRNVTKMRAKDLNVIDCIETWQEGYADPTRNGWHYLFYAAVTENPALVEYLTKEKLPSYP